MRRRTRIDLGQQIDDKLEKTLHRKASRWAARNSKKPAPENPFLKKIDPSAPGYGDSSETSEELQARLSNLEFGNYPGYQKYRTAAECEAVKVAQVAEDEAIPADGEGKNTDKPTTNLPIETPPSTISDSRINFFRKDWFQAKEVLDVGCNRGHIAYSISCLFSPKLIVGIDIDSKIINMANSDIHLLVEKELIPNSRKTRLSIAETLCSDHVEVYREFETHLPLSSYVAQGPIGPLQSFASDGHNTDIYQFPSNIIFLAHNYVLASDELVEKQEPKFDTIVCLSVTKWVHLNYRDEGLKRFFKRMYRHLRQDGLLILEAQPFDNYRRRKNLSDRLKSNYYSLKFKPEEFDSYLLSDQVGFRRILYESVTEHRCAGFKRPLKVFLK